ncbi:MAG: hypothetical protein RL616_2480 [Verrucomicrobiota bacterium]|jgi:hypothetical protein
MKSRQLANVLIKVLGLSVCIYAIPSCVGGIVFGLFSMTMSKTDVTLLRVISTAVGAGVQALVGLVIISMSQKIAGMMFKSEEE